VQYYKYPEGVMVLEVESGSAAEKAGILPFDIITEFDGEKITVYEELQAVMQYFRPGDVAKVTVERINNGRFEEVELEVTLGERTKE